MLIEIRYKENEIIITQPITWLRQYR